VQQSTVDLLHRLTEPNLSMADKARLLQDALDPRLEPWIAVTEELPDVDIEVLIANNAWDEPVCVGFLDGHFWVRCIAPSVPLDGLDCVGEFNAHMLEPTHWMPVPEPPTESGVAK